MGENPWEFESPHRHQFALCRFWQKWMLTGALVNSHFSVGADSAHPCASPYGRTACVQIANPGDLSNLPIGTNTGSLPGLQHRPFRALPWTSTSPSRLPESACSVGRSPAVNCQVVDYLQELSCQSVSRRRACLYNAVLQRLTLLLSLMSVDNYR